MNGYGFVQAAFNICLVRMRRSVTCFNLICYSLSPVHARMPIDLMVIILDIDVVACREPDRVCHITFGVSNLFLYEFSIL